MLTEKVDKSAYTRTHRSVAVVDGAKRHLYRQTFIGHQFNQLTARNFFINHIIG